MYVQLAVGAEDERPGDEFKLWALGTNLALQDSTLFFFNTEPFLSPYFFFH